MRDLNLRTIELTDIPSCINLCRLNNWNQTEKDWSLLLRMSDKDSRVAMINDEIMGSFTTINYEGLFSWIGMVLVNPAYQRHGIGKRLMDEAIKIQTNRGTIKLDATPTGRNLYLELGFEDEYSLVRLEAQSVVKENLKFSASKIHTSDLDRICEYDELIFGSKRNMLLNSFYYRVPQAAYCIEKEDRINGYCFGREGFKYNQIGPIIADTFEDAVELVSTALLNFSSKPMIIDSFLHDVRWVGWLKERGFTEQRGFTRMYKGENKHTGIPQKQYAVAGPEFG